MKTILLILTLMLTGCATEIVKKWHVPSNKMEAYHADETRCGSYARGVGGPRIQDVYDFCLQQAGYRLEITEE